MNRVYLMGNLTRDVELKSLTSGSVAAFGVAVTRRWAGADGEKKEETTFVDVTAWGKTGENIAKFFHKGSRILIEGRLKLDQWEDKEGNKRSKLSVVAEGFHFIDRKQDDAPRADRPAAKAGQSASPFSDDNIPF